VAGTRRGKRDPNSWMEIRLPERELGECVLDLAEPSLARLGPTPGAAAIRSAIEVAINFWNAQVRASEIWGDPRPKPLNDLRRKMTGKLAAPEDAETFRLLSQRWREMEFAFDPRLVGDWTLELGSDRRPRLSCEVALPEGVKVKIPPPIEERVGISGKFLDEVHIRLSSTSYLGFPVEAHQGVVGSDGSVTIRTKMPTAVALFTQGLLHPVNGAPVDLTLAGKKLSSMVLNEVSCLSNGGHHDVAMLVFKHAATGTGR
jgi:hypothetical protein